MKRWQKIVGTIFLFILTVCDIIAWKIIRESVLVYFEPPIEFGLEEDTTEFIRQIARNGIDQMGLLVLCHLIIAIVLFCWLWRGKR